MVHGIKFRLPTLTASSLLTELSWWCYLKSVGILRLISGLSVLYNCLLPHCYNNTILLSTFVLCAPDCLTIQTFCGSFVEILKMFFSISMKNDGRVNNYYIESTNHPGKYEHFNTVNSSSLWLWIITYQELSNLGKTNFLDNYNYLVYEKVKTPWIQHCPYIKSRQWYHRKGQARLWTGGWGTRNLVSSPGRQMEGKEGRQEASVLGEHRCRISQQMWAYGIQQHIKQSIHYDQLHCVTRVFQDKLINKCDISHQKNEEYKLYDYLIKCGRRGKSMWQNSVCLDDWELSLKFLKKEHTSAQ